MVFPYSFIDIIFRKDVLDNKSITDEIIKTFKPGKSHMDENLILVPCAMSNFDAENIVKSLQEKYGLTHTKDGKAIDFLVVNGPFGSTTKCDWIKRLCLTEELTINNISYKKGTPYYEFVK